MKRVKFHTSDNRQKHVSMALTATALVVVIALIVAFSFINSVKYDKDEVISQATDIVDILNTRNYRAFYNALPMYVRYGKTANDWKAYFDPILATAGSFTQYSGIKTSGDILNRMQSRNMQRINVTITAHYENATVRYKVVVTPSLQILDVSAKKLS